MLKFTKKTSQKAGTAPGTLVHIGDKKVDKARVTVIDFDSDQLKEQELDSIDDALQLKDLPTTTWLNIDGLHDIEIIESVGEHFNLHPLVLEDILNTGQRSKVDDFGEYAYIVLKMLHMDREKNEIRSEQISLVLGNHFLISFQEVEGDVFEPVRERIRRGRGRIRKSGCSYLAYALIDAIVDHYFIILETMGATIESLEEDLLAEPTSETMEAMHDLKRELIYVRKQVWPIREVINALIKGDISLVREQTVIFFRDVYDHTIQVIDTILSGMLDLYLSTISNRMNEVMKVLTIIATIFIPITFVAGIYGMNFKYMPELDWKWGYAAVWGIISVIALIMVTYFKRKKWI